MLALQNGVDVKILSAMLDHYSAGLTLDTYAHVTTSVQKQAANAVGSFLSVLSGDFRSRFPYGSRLGSNGHLKAQPPEKVLKARTKPRKSNEFPWLWYALKDLPSGFLVRSLSESSRQALSTPFDIVFSGYKQHFLLPTPIIPLGNFLFRVKLWVKQSCGEQAAASPCSYCGSTFRLKPV